MDWFSLFLVAVLFAVVYMQALQGVLSAAIMCGLVLLCTALAFATYEWVAMSYLLGPLGDLSMPVALVGTFIVPLIVSRILLDIYITRSSLIPALIDRAAAACVALVTAMTMAGVLALAILMSPLGGSFLGHTLMDPETGEEGSLWLAPDRFAVSVATHMSEGVFSGRHSFRDAHPDLVQEVCWAQSSPSGIRHIAPEGSITVQHVERRDFIFDKTIDERARRRDSTQGITHERVNPDNGRQWYLVRLKLGPDAMDDDKQHRFTRHQIRLVGRESSAGPTANYAPVAMTDNDNPKLAVRIENGKLYQPHEGSEVDFVFDVSERFVPEFIEYMVGARADLSQRAIGDSEAPEATQASAEPVSGTPAPAGDRRSRPRGRRSTDRVSGVRATQSSHFGDNLPTEMTDYQKFSLEQSRQTYSSGHVHGNVADQDGGSDAKLTKFAVPSDKRLLHLEVEELRARSGIGKVLSFAVTTVKQYQLQDEQGNVYPVVGQYAVVDIDGQDVVEIQYYPEAVAAGGRGGIRDFRRIKKRQLEARGSRLVYLFLVEPGARIASFSTGRRPTDLTELNLVAPS